MRACLEMCDIRIELKVVNLCKAKNNPQIRFPVEWKMKPGPRVTHIMVPIRQRTLSIQKCVEVAKFVEGGKLSPFGFIKKP